MKADKILVLIIRILCIALLIFSAIKLWSIWKDYKDAREINKKATVYIEESKEDENTDYYFKVDLVSLQKANPDIGGWIQIPDTPVNYPLLCPSNNEKYLRTTWNRKYAVGGSIWVEPKCSFEDSNNVIIYGHRMKDNSMFGCLRNYQDNRFLEKHPYIYIYYGTEETRYKITECKIVKTNDPIYDPSYGDEKQITLSTCTGEKNTRIVIIAKPDKVVWTASGQNMDSLGKD